MSDRSDKIRVFLTKKPRPHVVRVTDTSGKDHEFAVPQGARFRARDMAEEIETLDPARVQALDDTDMTIRAERYVLEHAPAGEAAAVISPRSQPSGPPTFDIPAVLASDAETARFIVMAQIVSHANHHTIDRTFAYFETIIERLDARELAREKEASDAREELKRMREQEREDLLDELEERFANAEENASAGGEGPEAIITSLINGMRQGQASKAKNGKRAN